MTCDSAVAVRDPGGARRRVVLVGAGAGLLLDPPPAVGHERVDVEVAHRLAVRTARVQDAFEHGLEHRPEAAGVAGGQQVDGPRITVVRTARRSVRSGASMSGLKPSEP